MTPALLFKRAFKRFQKVAPEKLESVEMFSFIEDWLVQGDWIAAGSVLMDRSYFDLGTSLGTVPDAEQRIMRLVTRWIDRMRPAYGIGFYRKRSRGPGAYGIGLAYGFGHELFGPEEDFYRAECQAINNWSQGVEQAVYDQGILRDVYPYSLLTPRHLKREVVDGIRLDDWIRAEPWRGELSVCEHEYSLWTVAHEHIPTVRRQLATAGALYVLPRDHHL